MRIIILNWRWDTGKVKLPTLFQVEKTTDLLYCTGYTKNELQNISEFLNDKKAEQILFLTHYKEGEKEEDDKKYIEPNTIIKNFKSFSNLKIKTFCGTTGSPDVNILYNKGLLHDSKKDFSEFNKKDNVCDSERFERVWEHYWNKLDLEYQKKKIINLWLPLAIDIQGLSEVENGKRQSYLEDVLDELDKKENGKTYAEILVEGWNEVKKVLLPEDGKQVLEDKYQIKGDEIEKVKFPIEKEKDDKGKFTKLDLNTLKSFIQENYKNTSSSNFLPNWLQEVVRVIDEKLKQNN